MVCVQRGEIRIGMERNVVCIRHATAWLLNDPQDSPHPSCRPRFRIGVLSCCTLVVPTRPAHMECENRLSMYLFIRRSRILLVDAISWDLTSAALRQPLKTTKTAMHPLRIPPRSRAEERTDLINPKARHDIPEARSFALSCHMAIEGIEAQNKSNTHPAWQSPP